MSRSPLSTPHKHLVVDLCGLVDARFGGVSAMVEHAVSTPDCPAWARGRDDDPLRAVKARRAVSRFLGSSARSAPDWPTVRWIVQECAEPRLRERVLPRLARLWRNGHGGRWPPGYVGEIDLHGGGVEHVPEPAPDPATEAALLRVRTAELAAELDQARSRVDALRQELAESHGRHSAALVSAGRDRQAADRTIERYRQLAVQSEKNNGVLGAELDNLKHLMAVVVADQVVSRAEPSPDLRRVADAMRVVEAAAGGSDWKLAYLRSLLHLAPAAFSVAGSDRRGDDVVERIGSGRLPEPEQLRWMVDRLPFFARRADVLLDAPPPPDRSPSARAPRERAG